VLDPTDLSVGDQGPGILSPTLEVPAVGYDHLFAGGVGLRDEVASIGRRRRQWLFHQEMAAFGKRCDCMLMVQQVRRRDHHPIHRDLIEHGTIILEPEPNIKFPLQLGQFLRAKAIDCNDLAILVRSQRRQMVDRRPPAGANHPNARPLSHSAPSLRVDRPGIALCRLRHVERVATSGRVSSAVEPALSFSHLDPLGHPT